MTKKTIKELADEIGVSKTAINKKIDDEFKRKHFSKEGNKFLVDEEGQELIKASFSETMEQKKQPETPTVPNEVNVSQTGELVSVLKDRLTSMDKQLETKDEQIKQLQKLLDQQQVLTLQANKKIEQLEHKIEEEPFVSNEELTHVTSSTEKVTPAPEKDVAKDTNQADKKEAISEKIEEKTESENSTVTEVSTEKVLTAEKIEDAKKEAVKETTTNTNIDPADGKKSLWKRLFK